MCEICKICGCSKVKVIYEGPLKTGLLTGHTERDYPVFQCDECKTIWNHAQEEEDKSFYESSEYRKRIEEDDHIETYYSKHDKEVLDKLKLTGTDIFRNSIVADIGCGGGSFLDFLSGVASEIIAVEPANMYHESLREKGYMTYSYASEVINDKGAYCDVVTSFDVIEHVLDPQNFANEMYSLCKEGGKIICGTPTDYPILRKMLGREFDAFIFQIQHPWILSEISLEKIFTNAGFHDISVKGVQKYGLGNLVAWLYERKPRGNISFDFISDTLNSTYMGEMATYFPEYLFVTATK